VDRVTKARRRYVAILWHPGVAFDDAIRLVKGADDPEEAMALVAPACTEDQRWAVVDLTTMDVVASGPVLRD
jgi:hypothetical protein